MVKIKTKVNLKNKKNKEKESIKNNNKKRDDKTNNEINEKEKDLHKFKLNKRLQIKTDSILSLDEKIQLYYQPIWILFQQKKENNMKE